MRKLEVEITKARHDWSVHSIMYWGNGFQPAHTYSPAPTLYWAIYEQASWCADNRTKLTRLDVKGKPYPRDKAEAAIRRATADGLRYNRQRALEALAI